MRVQRPFERAGSGSHIAQTTKAGGCPTGSSRSVRWFARVTVKGYAANGLVRGHEKAAIVAVIFEPDGGRRGADNENDEGAAFCCAEARASG